MTDEKTLREALHAVQFAFAPNRHHEVLSAAIDELVALRERGLSLREMQERLPWTIPYSEAFTASPEPHRNLTHDVMHVMKSLGRIAALAEDFDHGRAPRMTREQLAKELADLPICAMHIANTNPLGRIDLHDAVVTCSELRNSAPGALSSGAHATVGERDVLREELVKAHESLKESRRAHEDAMAERDEARAEVERLREALTKLDDACAEVASWSEECVDFNHPARVAARAALEGK